MAINIEELCLAVQRNCDISDAQYARNYTLCTYLLKMREYFRWEKGYAFHDTLPRDQLGLWLDAREALWLKLETDDFLPVLCSDAPHDPFNAKAINGELLARGLVYGGGYGLYGKPLFFLGRLLKHEQRQGHDILLSSVELARDLSAPPAMKQGNTIYVRRESVQRMLWEQIEEWNWKQPQNAMGRFMAAHDYDAQPVDALDRMTDDTVNIMILHELGEARAEALLGEEWEQMLLALTGSPAERIVRALRDHLADTLVTLPELIEVQADIAIHAYFSHFDAVRKELYPALMTAYQDGGRERLNWGGLRDIVQLGSVHWLGTCRRMLDVFHAGGIEAVKQLTDSNDAIIC